MSFFSTTHKEPNFAVLSSIGLDPIHAVSDPHPSYVTVTPRRRIFHGSRPMLLLTWIVYVGDSFRSGSSPLLQLWKLELGKLCSGKIYSIECSPFGVDRFRLGGTPTCDCQSTEGIQKLIYPLFGSPR